LDVWCLNFLNSTNVYTFFLFYQVAVPDVAEAAKDADILIFVVPHQFIRGLGAALLGKIKPTAVGLSLIKGFDVAEGGGMELISHIITRHLKVSHTLMARY
jgi:glycerol-3-phosphate dehydrogenase (NAD+)